MVSMTPDLIIDVTTDKTLNLTFGEEIDHFITNARRISEMLISEDEPFCHITYESAIDRNRKAATIKVRYSKKDIPPETDPDFIPVCVIFTKSGSVVEIETYMRHAIQIACDYILTMMRFDLDFRFVGGVFSGILDAHNKHITFRFDRIGNLGTMKTIRLMFG